MWINHRLNTHLSRLGHMEEVIHLQEPKHFEIYGIQNRSRWQREHQKFARFFFACCCQDRKFSIASFHQNPQFCNRWRYKVPPLGGAILANYIFKTLWAISPPCRATSERSSKWVPSNLGWINSWNFLLTVPYTSFTLFRVEPSNAK